MIYDRTKHQKRQLQIIKKIENQITSGNLKFSVVSKVDDYENDKRICLTSVHFPKKDLINRIEREIVSPLRKISPQHYYYKNTSLHMTIKNIRVINDPPNFTQQDIEKVKHLYDILIPQHQSFNVYFYRLLMLPMNLSLIGTTDPQLDEIFFDLDKNLKEIGVPDDKQYANSRYFFSNMTLVRFTKKPTEQFKKKIAEISNSLSLNPYKVDSVSLITCNASLSKYRKIKSWKFN